MNWSGHHLFREAAVIKWSQSEPLDGLANSTLPHQRLVSVGLLAGLAAFVLWCATATLERNLWLTGELDRSDMGELRVQVLVHGHEAKHLRAGGLAKILDPKGRSAPVTGEVIEIIRPDKGEDPVQAVWRIAEPAPWMKVGETCGLRVPAGRSRAVEVIFDAIR